MDILVFLSEPSSSDFTISYAPTSTITHSSTKAFSFTTTPSITLSIATFSTVHASISSSNVSAFVCRNMFTLVVCILWNVPNLLRLQILTV